MKKYVIKRDEGNLPERLTRYRNELNEEQFRAVTAPPKASLGCRRCGNGQNADDHLPRRVSDRTGRFAAENFAGDFYESRGA